MCKAFQINLKMYGAVHRTAFFSLNKLNKFVKVHKNLTSKEQKKMSFIK